MRSGIPRKGLVDLYAEVSTIFDLVVTFVGIISLVGSSYYMLHWHIVFTARDLRALRTLGSHAVKYAIRY